MENIIKHFKALVLCEQFIVTGSFALHMYGLTDQPKDLDIILVNPQPESIDALKRLMEANHCKTKPIEGSDLIAIIKHNDVKIDFFKSTKRQNTLQTTSFEMAKVSDIVAAKKRIGRLKDWEQLRRISNKILSKDEFWHGLNTAKLDHSGY
jgi:hypothetical protein